MKKRVTAALLAILIGGLSCPAAGAADLPEPPADSGYIEEQRPTESTQGPGAIEETPPEPPAETPAPEPPPVQEPPVETPAPEPPPSELPSNDPAAETPNALSPEQPPNELPLEVTPPPPEEDGCDTIEELAERIAQDGGGTVTITGDLSLPKGETVWLEAGQPVTIDLGPHGITVPEGAALALSGPITLTGDGAPDPLLTISGFLTTENGALLSASGEQAVAVRLTGGGWNTNRASVEAAGAGACAVESDGPLNLYRLHLTARGENAVCVRATARVQLTLSRAESDGALAEVPALTLDGTAASPEPEDARVIRRAAVPHDHYETNGLWIEAGASREELDALLESRLLSTRFEYGLSDETGQEEDLLYFTAMSWTDEGIDLDVPGVCWLTGVPEDWDLGSVAPPEKRVPVHVADPDKPAIREGYQTDGGVRLAFYRPIRGAERLKLWYSADLGGTWQDAGTLPGAEIGPEGANFPALPEPNRDYLFRLEVEGGPMAGRSNTLRCLYYDNQWGGGGDWDGGDWGDQGPLPDDDPGPPPDREPGRDPSPSPEPDDTASGSDREEGADDPPAVSAPSPVPDLPDIEVSFVEPVSTSEPTPATLPGETTPPVKPNSPASPTQAEPAPITTPASTPPAAAPSGEPGSAQPEGATVCLTGRDLEAQKLANPSGVTLAGDGLKVTLPYALTDALGLGKEGVLAVRLAMPDPTSFEVRFWADGQEVADFGGGAFTITVPVEEADGAEYLCVAPDGTEIAAADLGGGRAEFALSATGVYTLSAAQAPAPVPELQTGTPAARDARPIPILPLLGTLALAAGGILLLRRRRGGG